MPLVVGLDLAVALRLAAERAAAVQVGVVVDLHERLERHAEPLAVAQHAAVVIGNAPRTRIDVQVLVELALLRDAAEFRVAVAAAQAPIASARPAVVFQHLHLVAGVAQLVGGAHAGHARAQNQHRGAPGRALQIDRDLDRGSRPQTPGCSWPDTWRRCPRRLRSCAAGRGGSEKTRQNCFPSLPRQ